jgi:hypothetical protein
MTWRTSSLPPICQFCTANLDEQRHKSWCPTKDGYLDGHIESGLVAKEVCGPHGCTLPCEYCSPAAVEHGGNDSQ